MRLIFGTAFCFATACAPHVVPHEWTPPAQGLPPLRAAPAWTASERARLAGSLRERFSSDIFDSGGVAVVAQDGSVLFGQRAKSPVTPASTLKLVVGAVSLNLLGPAHRFETTFASLDGPDAIGVMHGPLWLIGGGDPWLASDDLRGGVGVLVREGVRRIEGGIVVDDAAFAGPEQNPRWEPDDLVEDYAAGSSAISLDQGTVEFHVIPGVPGTAATVKIEPPNSNVAISGSIRTVGAGADTDLSIDRKADPDPPGKPIGEPNRNAFVVDGSIPSGDEQKFWKPVLGFGYYVGGALAGMLAQRNVYLTGGLHVGAVPVAAKTLWTHRSQPLAVLLHDMLVESNNHTAEQLLRIVGEGDGHAGTSTSGIAVERHELRRLGVWADSMRVYDGSGLAPSDRIAALTLAELVAAESRGPQRDAFVRSLPLVGEEGTVRHHDVNSALGRARAKSGHIQNVNALAGTIQTRHHGRVSFAFIVNDPRCDADVVTQAQDRAMDLLADS